MVIARQRQRDKKGKNIFVKVLLFALMFLVFFYSSTSKTMLIGIASLLLFLWVVVSNRGRLFFGNGVSLLVFLIALQAMTVFSDAINGHSILSSSAYLLIFLCLFLFAVNQKGGRLYTASLWFAFLVAFIGGPIAGIYQLITKQYIFDFFSTQQQAQNNAITYLMFSANSGNSDYASMHMMVSGFLSLVLYNKKKNFLFVLAAIVSFVCMIMTFSRATLLGVIFSLFLFVVFKNSRRIKRKDIRINPILLLFVPVLFFLPLVFANQIGELVDKYFSNPYALQNFQYKQTFNGLSSRLAIWNDIVNMMSHSSTKNFLFGYGSDYANALGEYSGRVISAHNFILGQFATNGLVGLFVAVVFFVYMFVLGFSYLRSNNSELAIFGFVIVTYFVNYMFISIYDMVLVVSFLLITMKGRRSIVQERTISFEAVKK